MSKPRCFPSKITLELRLHNMHELMNFNTGLKNARPITVSPNLIKLYIIKSLAIRDIILSLWLRSISQTNAKK